MNALGPVVRWAVRDWVAHVLVGNPLALQEEVPHPPVPPPPSHAQPHSILFKPHCKGMPEPRYDWWSG